MKMDGNKVKHVYFQGRGGGFFPYILSNEIETMFSQLVSWLCALRQTKGFCGRNKNIAVEGGTVSGNSQIY